VLDCENQRNVETVVSIIAAIFLQNSFIDAKYHTMRAKILKKVYVALSGGVDSSVAAALLEKRGFNVTGVYMKQWTPEILGRECLWKRDREDALRVAVKLNIPLLTWDFSKEYEKEVGKYMIDAYRRGITPNPDVMCNKVIKFGLFFKKAMKEGADFIATGHYARLWKEPVPRLPLDSPARNLAAFRRSLSRSARTMSASLLEARFVTSSFRNKLTAARDKNKDQTYFLWTLNQKILAKTLFPIGDYTKLEVRKMAKKFGLPTADKKDSQGVCFIGPLNIKQFLKEYIKPKKGKIILIDSLSLRSGRSNNKVIGTHDGVYYYTIGQRHGLDIKLGGGPYYIVKKDVKKNIIYVGSESDLRASQVRIKDLHWLNKPKKFPALLDVKIRYRTPSDKATLSAGGNLRFKKPQRAITSGQSAVFYRGQELIGGGIIK